MRTSIPRPSRTAVSALCVAAALLAGCASRSTGAPATPTADTAVPSGVATSGPTGVRRFLGAFSPYRVTIQQGNFISREMVTQLKEGMQSKDGVTPEQVRFVLGTPLLTDIFHADRWDYVFHLKKGNGEIFSSRVTVFFKDNRVVNIDSGVLPTEQEYLALIAGKPSAPSSK